MGIKRCEPAQFVIELGPGAGLPLGRYRDATINSSTAASIYRLWISSSSPGSPRRRSTGSLPRTRMATPFQLF
jgi:hypothetical protein